MSSLGAIVFVELIIVGFPQTKNDKSLAYNDSWLLSWVKDISRELMIDEDNSAWAEDTYTTIDCTFISKSKRYISWSLAAVIGTVNCFNDSDNNSRFPRPPASSIDSIVKTEYWQQF